MLKAMDLPTLVRTVSQQEAQKKLPETGVVLTGGGGLHYYFQYPKEQIGNRTGFRPGLDYKTTGGYVVAPPSNHVSGGKYEWVNPGAALAEMPQWLVQVFMEKPLPKPAETKSATGKISGERNNHLFQLGLSLRRSGMEEAEIITALLSHNELHCEPPLDDVEVRRTAISAARYETAADSLHHTDMANAAWLVQEFGYNIRFCTDWNKWLVWDGKRFKTDNTYEIDRLAKETARRMRSCAETLTDKGDKNRLIVHSLKSEAINRLRAMIELAKSAPGIAVASDVFDKNPWLFNCENGTLNLKPVVFRLVL